MSNFSPPLRYLLFLLPLLLLSCGSPEQPPLQQRSLYVFGTLVDITASSVSQSEFSAAIIDIEAAFQAMHRDWHAWKPGTLFAANQAIAKGESYPIDDDLIWLIRRSAQLSLQSNGLFNPAIGGLIELWGFHTDDYPVQGAPPSQEQIDVWLAAQPQMRDLSICEDRLSSTNKAVQLDFGGMAKGLAVDRAMAILARHGIDNAIVNAGGDLRARGRRDDGPWRIGVRHPQGDGVIAALEIQGDEAVFTSGNYERYRQHNNERWPHIIDPRTGQPVQHVASATVIHQDASIADAAATALVVAGPDAWLAIAEKMGVSRAMLVDDQGRVFVTVELSERLSFEGEADVEIVTF